MSCPMIGAGPSSLPGGQNRPRSMTPRRRLSTEPGAPPGTREASSSSTGGTAPSASATRMGMIRFRREDNRARGSEAADRGERSVCRCAAESTELAMCMTAHVEDRMVDENARGPKRPVRSWKRMLLMATVNPTFVAIQNPTVLACRLRSSRPAVLGFQQNWPRGTDARMEDQDLAETLSRPGRLEDGAGASFRDQSHDDPPLNQDRAAGPEPAGRSVRRFIRCTLRWLTSGSLQGDHRRAS